MKVTWFGHSAVRVENGSHVILIDPFLVAESRIQGSVEEAARGATHVVLTHGHDDHVGDTVSICKSTGATLVAGFELAMYLAGQGVAKLEPGNAGGTISLEGGVSVSFVPAHHSSSTIVDGKPVCSATLAVWFCKALADDLPYGRYGYFQRYGAG